MCVVAVCGAPYSPDKHHQHSKKGLAIRYSPTVPFTGDVLGTAVSRATCVSDIEKEEQPKHSSVFR